MKAWTSKKAIAARVGTGIYLLEDGREVEAVGQTKDLSNSNIAWSDKESLGEVDCYLRQGRRTRLLRTRWGEPRRRRDPARVRPGEHQSPNQPRDKKP